MELEIAVQDVTGARLAAIHGADRVEVCCALQLGGLTPSHGLLTSIRAAVPDLPLHVLIRPRPGDYVYDAATVALMVAEIQAVHDAGASGVVIGALTSEDQIDYATVAVLIAATQGLHITFHRAIDHLSLDDAVAAVPRLAELGVQRILSSGGAARAGEGRAQLRAMHQAAKGQLRIMAGGGVEISDFADFNDDGLCDVHLSAKATIDIAPPRPWTQAAAAEDPSYFVTDPQLVSHAGRAVLALP
ncbi:copper homeostasis protein CutC [Arthrobacter psychrolactophilus]